MLQGLLGPPFLASWPAGFGAAAPLIAGAAGEGFVGAGSAAEQYRVWWRPHCQPGCRTIASGAGTGRCLFWVGRWRKSGITDMDTALAGGVLKPADVKHGLARTLAEAGVLKLLEEMPQSAQERIWQNIATDRPALEGVPEAAAQGLIAGCGHGGRLLEQRAGLTLTDAGRSWPNNTARPWRTMSKLIEASKLRQRDPEAFAAFAQSLTDEGCRASTWTPARCSNPASTCRRWPRPCPAWRSRSNRRRLRAAMWSSPPRSSPTQAPGQVVGRADRPRPHRGRRDEPGRRAGVHASPRRAAAGWRLPAPSSSTPPIPNGRPGATPCADFQRQLDEVGRWQPEVNRQYAALLGDYYPPPRRSGQHDAAGVGQRATRCASRRRRRTVGECDGAGRHLAQTTRVDRGSQQGLLCHGCRAASGEQVDPTSMRLADEQSSAQDARCPLASRPSPTRLSACRRPRDGRMLVLNASAQQPGKWQLTRFDKDGVPFMDTQHDTKLSAVKVRARVGPEQHQEL